MPRYYFVLQWPDGEHDDRLGTVLPHDGAAHAYASRVIQELKDGGGYTDPGLAMIVKNEAHKIVFSIPFRHLWP